MSHKVVTVGMQALMPVAVFVVGCAFQTETFSSSTFANMLVVSLGVAIASYGTCSCTELLITLQSWMSLLCCKIIMYKFAISHCA